MRKLNIMGGTTFLLAMLMLVSAFAGVNTPSTTSDAADEKILDISLTFLPEMEEEEGYIVVDFEGGTNHIVRDGYPSLPYRVEVLKFPAGTRIDGVKWSVKGEEIIHLEKKILPAAPTVRMDMDVSKVERKEGSIYGSTEMYPEDWLSYHIGAGIDEGEHVIYLSLHIYPIRYIPAANEIHSINGMKIVVKYTPPSKPMFTVDTYDLLIIAPDDWMADLQPLKEHKESHGIKTIIVGLDEIYSGKYFTTQGRDDAEKIKYFIKDAIENWGIKYVMLVGGRQGGVFKERWLMPVRYSHLDDGGEATFASDLYFADLYKYENGNLVFEDWDSNGNGVFGEWVMFGKDMLDLYPDVYLGRLACRNILDLRTMVEKIITYENTAKGSQWAKRFVGIAGDTYPGEDDPYYEGELATKAAFEYLNDFTSNFVWTSTGNLSSENDIINAISEGCGFLHFSGHGNPMSWANHPPHDENTWIGIDVTKFYKLSNDGMYPVCIVGGCHNNQFNVSVFNLLKLKHLKEVYYKSEWSPKCWGWWLASKPGGGTIATIANTGYGYGIPGEECLTGRGRYMEIQFFRSYAEGKDVLGETHASDLTYYLNAFPPMSDLIDTKIVEQWILLGDPSLKIGGY
ncbi:MAG: peptidase C25 [Thermoplasmata archaeon]|nr:peptidase C25 [Thermoplasmata archaeon]